MVARDWAVKRWATAVLVAGLCSVGSASATLVDRGNGLIYDDQLNITWLQDANLAATNTFGTGLGEFMPWFFAQFWIDAMNTAAYKGYSDWRLPYASVSAGAGPITTLPILRPCTGLGGADETSCRDNEMAYMFYYNLDGTGLPETGTQVVDGVTLNNIQNTYWSGTQFGGFGVWGFYFDSGFQFNIDSGDRYFAWAVRSGDSVAAAVPEPACLLLIGAGMLGLISSRRRSRRR